MGLHNDIIFRVGIKSAEDADKFSKALLNDDEDYSFKTGDLFITTCDCGCSEYENGFLTITGETGFRKIDQHNTHLLFKEIKDVAAKNSVTLESIRITFISQEDDGIHVYVDKLSEEAFSNFCKNYFDPDYYLESEEECEARKKQFENAIWVVSVSYDSIDGLIENDEEGREDPWEFTDEILSRINDLIEKYNFPEDITAYLTAYDSNDGEELYEDFE